MGKEYDTSLKLEDFVEHHKRLLPLLFRALKPGGNLCWQVGHHVRKGVTTPLDCQFPVALVQRLVTALTPKGGIVVDPFMGSGSACLAAAIEDRKFLGCDIDAAYVKIAKNRMNDFTKGSISVRPLEKPIHIPNGKEAVSIRPPHFENLQ
jgi:adenine-specific DNA-methyltransferase